MLLGVLLSAVAKCAVCSWGKAGEVGRGLFACADMHRLLTACMPHRPGAACSVPRPASYLRV